MKGVLSRRRLLGLVVASALLAVAWRSLPSLSYGPAGPTRVGRFFVWLWARYSMLGLPPSWQVALEVRGRRTGEARVLPVVVASVEGKDYLVSMLGERAAWVKNARAAGGEAIIIHGARRAVRLAEVAPAERPRIIKAYLARAIGGRPHIPVPHDAPVEDFQSIAQDFPVFRIDPREGVV